MIRTAYLAAPACVLAYGVSRFIDGLDGTHGPGPAWTIGHLFFLAAMVLFGVVLIGLRRDVTRARGLATAAAAIGMVGLLGFVRVILVDLIVGFRSADREAMNNLYPHYDGFPGQLPTGLTSAFDNIAPPLFVVALLVLTILVVVANQLRWWSPVLVLIGFGAISANLDLLPLGGLLVLAGLWPMARGTAARPAAVPVGS